MTQHPIESDQLRKLDIPYFKVDSNKYTTPSLTCRNGKMLLCMKSIRNLDDSIIAEPGLLTLSIQFPFKMPYGTALKGNGEYISIRNIIDTTREAYRSTYRNLTSFPCEIEKTKMDSELFELTYPLDSLFVEGIFYCSVRKVVKVNTKGYPKVRKGPDIPF